MLRCLDALLQQDHPSFEVLVLDNGSSDGTPEACAERAATSDVPVRVEVLSGTVGAFHLFELIGEIGLLHTAAEEFVHLQIHAGIHHDGAVAIDHLKRRARLDARVLGGAFDREILGPAALGEFQHIDPQRLGAGKQPRDLTDILDVCRPGRRRLCGGRHETEKQERKGKQGRAHRRARGRLIAASIA